MAKFTCPVCNKPSTKEGGCFKHIPRKPLKTSKLKKKPKSEEEKNTTKLAIEKQREFFLHIWNNRGPYSEISGRWLDTEVKSIYCHHILPKAKYKQAEFDEENIIILSFTEHQKVEQDMYFYEEINKRREYLIKKYNLINFK